jgi:hypothetical protein
LKLLERAGFRKKYIYAAFSQPANAGPQAFNYHGPMTKKHLWTFGGLWLAAPLLLAQTAVPEPAAPKAPDAAVVQVVPTPEDSSLDGELFYQLLVGEITAQEGEPGAGFSLMLDAARKTNDAQLYQRATEIALQARSGDAALQAAQAWKQAQPTSRDPNRYVLQILIALNRIGDSLGPLKTGIELAPHLDGPL